MRSTHAVDKRRMLSASVYLSNPCDLNCPYCYVEEKNSFRKARKPNELDLEETKRVINDLCSWGAKTINIVGAGGICGKDRSPRCFFLLNRYIHNAILTFAC